MKLDILTTLAKNKFLFDELVKRDFKKKYKRTVLGFFWSMLSPFMMLGVMAFVFNQFFGRMIEHYVLYILAGQIVFGYFSESTNTGMTALLNNSEIFSKINIPKFLFVLSRNISALINFGMTVLIFFVFIFATGVSPSFLMLLIVYPIVCLIIFNYGIGLILSALYIFFRDIQYLYSLALQVIMYGSAIFYDINMLDSEYRIVFYFNPIYIFTTFIRDVAIYGNVPSALVTILCAVYSLLALFIGFFVYKKYDYRFIYYI